MGVLLRPRPLRGPEKALLWAAAGALLKRVRERHGDALARTAEKAHAYVAPKQVDRGWIGMFKASAAKFSADDAPRRGAALSYYTIFSLAPLLLITMSIVGFVMGSGAANSFIGGQLTQFFGADKARALQDMIASAKSSGKATAGLFGLATLLVGAGAVVSELQSSLDTIWGSPPAHGGIVGTVKNKLFSMGFVLAIGFMLLVSLIVSSALSALGKWAGGAMPVPPAALQAVNFAVSFVVIASMFALMFRYLPRAKVAWRDVRFGAAFTAALFLLGNWALGLYLGKAGPTSTYGAAGSLLAVLLWSYYCAQILFFGAEFTRVYAQRRGSGLPAPEGQRT